MRGARQVFAASSFHDKHLQARLRVQSQLRGVFRRRLTRGGREDWFEDEASEAEKDGIGWDHTVFPGNCF
jgi:hypothetical protein